MAGAAIHSPCLSVCWKAKFLETKRNGAAVAEGDRAALAAQAAAVAAEERDGGVSGDGDGGSKQREREREGERETK